MITPFTIPDKKVWNITPYIRTLWNFFRFEYQNLQIIQKILPLGHCGIFSDFTKSFYLNYGKKERAAHFQTGIVFLYLMRMYGSIITSMGWVARLCSAMRLYGSTITYRNEWHGCFYDFIIFSFETSVLICLQNYINISLKICQYFLVRLF